MSENNIMQTSYILLLTSLLYCFCSLLLLHLLPSKSSCFCCTSSPTYSLAPSAPLSLHILKLFCSASLPPLLFLIIIILLLLLLLLLLLQLLLMLHLLLSLLLLLLLLFPILPLILQVHLLCYSSPFSSCSSSFYPTFTTFELKLVDLSLYLFMYTCQNYCVELTR